jgi:hypothetical protein
MLDTIARKRALIETIKRLESDSDLGAMESVAATLTSVAQAPAPKIRKPKKEVNQLNSKKNITDDENSYEACVVKGDKSVNPRELIGIWKNKSITLEEIRKKDWTRNWNL